MAALREEIRLGTGADRRLDAFVAATEREVPTEAGARRFVERLALGLQGSLLVRFASPALADAFCASRLSGEWSGAYGTLPGGVDIASLVAEAVA